MDNMYGRCWYMGQKGLGKIDCDYTEEGGSGSELLQNAREGNKPLMGKGDPTSPIQTGMRDKPRANPSSGSPRRRFSGATNGREGRPARPAIIICTVVGPPAGAATSKSWS